VQIRVCDDPDQCRHLWRELWPQTCFFDLWQVRWIFAESFNQRPFFLVAEESGESVGMLALSFLEELQEFVHFPGEIWQQKTWIEQNKIPARDQVIRNELLAAIPDKAYLRYLSPENEPLKDFSFVLDEENFRFFPRYHGFSFDSYMKEFSHKSRKNLFRELEKLEGHGLTYRYDHFSDIEHLLELNMTAYGDFSYFADPRFLKAFVRLCEWLFEQGMLRITTLLLGRRIAAVDAGAVWNKQYTVLAGGTNGDFPGVAKMINFRHIAWACAEHLEVVDFLCGDFGWKRRFHLQPCPLYKIQIYPTKNEHFTSMSISMPDRSFE
jgi:CelD/BcsL family acetyltransferase involved in cellulose biosynthesis